MGPHVLAHLRPHRQQHALALVVAGTVLVWRAEVTGHDRAVDGAHDLAQGDLVRRPGQDVATAHAPLGAHEAGALQSQENLLEVRLG